MGYVTYIGSTSAIRKFYFRAELQMQYEADFAAHGDSILPTPFYVVHVRRDGEKHRSTTDLVK